MEADLAAVEARLGEAGYADRTPQFRLDQERTYRDELRSRIDAAKEALAIEVVPVAGGLPADGVGRWSPLPLFEKPPSEAEGELPPAVLEVSEPEVVDREAISREIFEIVRRAENSRRLVELARRWRGDATLLRLLVASLRTMGRVLLADKLAGRTPAPIIPREFVMPPTPFLTMATEWPDEFDGLTRTQRVVLEVVKVAAPPGRPFMRLSELAAEVAVRKPALGEVAVEWALISLGHPSLRRIPLVEMQGFSGRFTPAATHLTHARLTKEGLELLEESLALPMLLINGAEGQGTCVPPHSPKEILTAALFVVESPRPDQFELKRMMQGPDLPDGGVISYAGIQNLWQRGAGTLTARARIEVEFEEHSGKARIVIGQFPWPMSAPRVCEELHALRLDGVTAIRDHSSATSTNVVVELEHLAFSGTVQQAIFKSSVCQRSFEGALMVDGPSGPRQVDLADLLRAFVEHRREVAVKKLDRAVASARLRAQNMEAVCLALALLEPVQAVMRASLDDAEAVEGLMNFMKPEYREAIEKLPFPETHQYARGFTEKQARHLVSVRKLATRRIESAQQDWASARSALGEAAALLNDRQAILGVVRQELKAALTRYDEPRRSELSTWTASRFLR